ncbi:hypothetical protein [Paenibacillus sp. Y412MC10]|uniref:hypothetical protein n=1 Tax=Geobacillus sp. (strain Y412MC10) TaxID=481743 RepID=UPI0011A03F2E|nr:hypothetical protein [Paenibacillus sp. Y412MC10]
MIIKNGTPVIGQLVEVYVNLHKSGMFSIVDREPKSKSPTSGKVLAYAERVQLSDAVFKIADGKYKWILENQCRAVCAVCIGYLVAVDNECPADLDQVVRYNPYRARNFHTPTGQVVEKANRIHFERQAGFIAAS